MAHRETTAAVCGLVLGTLIGAGFVSAGRDATASLIEIDRQFVSYRQGVIQKDAYRRRSISEKDRQTRPQAKIRSVDERKVKQEVQEPAVIEGPVVDPSECAAKVRIANELEAIVIPLIPDRPLEQLVRSAIQNAFNAYRKDCMPYTVEQEVEEEKATSFEVKVQRGKVRRMQPKADSRCYEYSGTRRSRCIARSRGY
tara:strand:+ start:125 stop:718 length:594 start_codon:yes stop_codon:yes gene_type:complete